MKANPAASPPHPYHLIVGLDRSDAKADLFYIDTCSGRRWSQVLDTAPERLHDWLANLRHDYPRAKVAVCIEQPAVNLILFLEDLPLDHPLPHQPHHPPEVPRGLRHQSRQG